MNTLATILLTWMTMHPSHVTTCEMQWNAETHVVEVALRLAVADEAVLVPKIARLSPQDQAARAADVLAARMPLMAAKRTDAETGPAKKMPADDLVDAAVSADRYRWIGRQEEGFHVWWYFEFKPENGQPPARLRSTLLRHHLLGVIDDDPNHRHSLVRGTFTVLGFDKPWSTTVTGEKPDAELRWPDAPVGAKAESASAVQQNDESGDQPGKDQ